MGNFTIYWTDWKFRAGIALAGLVSFGAALAVVNTAWDTATSVWVKAETVYEYAATPWLGVFVLMAVTILVAWGMKDATAAIAKGSLVDQEKWAKETKERSRTLEIPILMAKHHAMVSTNRQAELHFLEADQFIDDLELCSARFLGEDIFSVQSEGGKLLMPEVSKLGRFGVPFGTVPEADIVWEPTTYGRGERPKQEEKIYDPSRNGAYMDYLKACIHLARGHVGGMRLRHEIQQARADELDGLIKKKAEEYEI